MSEGKFTSGTWEFALRPAPDGGNDVLDVFSGETVICGWWTWGDRPDERKANAHLIAAAPELYAALAKIEADWDGEPKDMIEARAALRKALGIPPSSIQGGG
jgi:hypothetical protein